MTPDPNPHLPEIASLCKRFGVRKLDLFGSATTGRFDPAHSDSARRCRS